jgi:hypothetical protein
MKQQNGEKIEFTRYLPSLGDQSHRPKNAKLLEPHGKK